MNSRSSLVVLVLVLVLGFGCQSNESRQSHADAAPSAQTQSASLGPSAALEQLDQRRPVPLLPIMAQHQKQNMREHLEAVQEVVAAAAAGDFDQVALAAKRMGYSESMGHQCERMGAGAPGFSERALNFHHTADEIALAATKQDGPAVWSALSKTLRACTSCHAMYKQQLVANLPQ